MALTQASGSVWNPEDNTYKHSGAGGIARNLRSRLEGNVFVEDFGAIGDGVVDDTAAIQLAMNCGAKAIHYDSSKSYLQGSVTVPTEIIVAGNNCTILPLLNPTQCFLVASSLGNDREAITIGDFVVTGSSQNFIRMTGSYLWHNAIKNIDHRSGTCNAIIKTEPVLGSNPSGFRITNINALHTGVKYGWFSTVAGGDEAVSYDHVQVDHIEMWPSAAGYPVRVQHKLSGNIFIDKLYHGAGSGVGGGVLYVNQMEHGKIGQLWSEASNGDIDVMSGSYQNVQIEVLLAQTNTATEASTTKLVNAHMFHCDIKKSYFLDDAASGYERDSSPPAGYKCFTFGNDSSGHISRDVRIGNIKGNFNHGHLINATGQGIVFVGKQGDDLVYCSHAETPYTTVSPDAAIIATPGYNFLTISNWEWGYDEEAIEIEIHGEWVGANVKDVRFYFEDANHELFRLDQIGAGGFYCKAIVKAHNDGSNRLWVNGHSIHNAAIDHRYSNNGNTWVRSDTATSLIYIFASVMDVADSCEIHSITVRPLRSTVR